jgi:dihydroxyacetone kinase-like predicted kinase
VAAILPPFAELITIYTGEGSLPSASKSLEAWLGELHPRLTVCEIDGGQPLYPYLVSIE